MILFDSLEISLSHPKDSKGPVFKTDRLEPSVRLPIGGERRANSPSPLALPDPGPFGGLE